MRKVLAFILAICCIHTLLCVPCEAGGFGVGFSWSGGSSGYRAPRRVTNNYYGAGGCPNCPAPAATYAAPVYSAPVYSTPVYSTQVYSAPVVVQSAPIVSAPVVVEAAPVYASVPCPHCGGTGTVQQRVSVSGKKYKYRMSVTPRRTKIAIEAR